MSRNSRRFYSCVLFFAVVCATSGCASIFYKNTPTGKFSGKLDVEWIAPNQFIYRPHPGEPLVYVTSEGRSIQPRVMYTDGGSIPRLLWSSQGFSPWEFAPGYIIHDWLFVQHHCKEGDWQMYDFPSSAKILAEAIKTQMEKAGAVEPVLVWAIYQAVSTQIAKQLWDFGECREAPAAAVAAPLPPGPAPFSKPVKIMTIEIK
jgi:hypothetical protein